MQSVKGSLLLGAEQQNEVGSDWPESIIPLARGNVLVTQNEG